MVRHFSGDLGWKHQGQGEVTLQKVLRICASFDRKETWKSGPARSLLWDKAVYSWLGVHYSKIPIYPIFYLLKGEYRLGTWAPGSLL